MAELRKAAGYTQQELAEEIGASRRIIAYYETQSDYPPATLLPQLAKALGIRIEDMLGSRLLPQTRKPASSRLQRRLQQIEKLNTKEKRQVMQLLDAFIEREKLKKKVAMG